MLTDMRNQDSIPSGAKGVVVITGASAGLGRVTARAFAQNGYDVALLARGVEGLAAAKQEVESYGRKGLYFALDVADAAAVEAAAAQTEAQLGPIAVWVNNAMNSVFSPVKQMQPEEYKRVTEVTYLGQVYGALAALKRMLARDKGVIVFVGSALAYRGIPLQSAYCGAKHATQGFFDSLRSELLHDKTKVQICMVQLPAMNTTQFQFVKSRLPNKPMPIGKIYQPEVAAEAIVYAAENPRREIWVGSTTVKAIVGNRIAPWYADWVLSRQGYEGQQTKEPEDPARPHNLWQPIPGDHGGHGPFGDISVDHSTTVWLSLNRDKVLAGLLGLGAVLLGGYFLGRSPKQAAAHQ